MLTTKLKLFLGGIIAKRIDVWFFYGFLITFPLSIRKVLTFYPIKGAFNEYTGIYLYLSDLFLLATLGLWGITILCNNWCYLSIFSFSGLKESILSKKWLTIRINPLIILPLLLVIWSFISINWSINQTIALFRSVKLLEFFLLYLYIRQNFNNLFSDNLFHACPTKCSTPAPSDVPRGTSRLGWNIPTEVKQNTQNINFENCSTRLDSQRCIVDARRAGNNYNLNNLDQTKVFRNFILVFITIGLFNAFLAFLQIVNNGSIGLQFLKESIFNLNMTGVAKITLGDKPFIRPYGLFPHPNILGAYLLVSTGLGFWYFQLVGDNKANCSTWNNFSRFSFWGKFKNLFFAKLNIFCSTWNKIRNLKIFSKSKKLLFHVKHFVRTLFHMEHFSKALFHVEQFLKTLFHGENSASRALLYSLIWLFPLLALFLTFSKNAVIGLFIAIFVTNYLLYLYKNGCSTLNLAYLKLFLKRKVFIKKNILLMGILVMILVNLHPSVESLFSRSLDDRLIFQNVSRGTISHNLILGVGMGQFIPTMNRYSNMPLLTWQYQPVHNVFSLIWSELGVIGLMLFIGFIFAIFRSFRVDLGTNPQLIHRKAVFRGLFLAFLFMLLFDHYFWDIQQGMALWWIIVALA